MTHSDSKPKTRKPMSSPFQPSNSQSLQVVVSLIPPIAKPNSKPIHFRQGLSLQGAALELKQMDGNKSITCTITWQSKVLLYTLFSFEARLRFHARAGLGKQTNIFGYHAISRLWYSCLKRCTSQLLKKQSGKQSYHHVLCHGMKITHRFLPEKRSERSFPT